MIKGLTGGAYLNVMGGSTSVPYVGSNTSNPMQGMVRINGSDLQVFDGSSWLSMGGSYATVDLNPDAQSILEWARKKMNEESEWIRLAEKNKSVAIALENLNKAREQLMTVTILAKEHNETTTS